VKGNHLKPEVFGFFGSPGSGKSHALWQTHLSLKKLQTLAWSPKELDSKGNPLDDYAGRLKCKRFTNFQEFVRESRSGRDAVFIPTRNRETDKAMFKIFCRLCLALAPVEMIVEEVQTVTDSSGGCVEWSDATLIGRGEGLRILVSSQRPANVDKDFYTAISGAWCGRQNFIEDAKTTANLVLRKYQEIMALPEHTGLTRTM
jgi:hypothetical protein